MRRSLPEFCKGAWHILEPATPLTWGWHLDAICEHLTAVTSGQIRNLIINIAPGHMKSLLVSVFWPCWEWITYPEHRWLFASYASSLSIRDSLKCRRLIESTWYQNHFGGRFELGDDEFYACNEEGQSVPIIGKRAFELLDDQNAKIKFENNKTGFRLATSVNGASTGERGHRVVSDDPHNVKERESDKKRTAVLDWHDNVFSNRLCDYRTDARILVHQRVHENDLTGHLIKRGDYIHLCLPTEYEPDRKCMTVIGWEDPRTQENELLFPERFGPAEVAEAKLTLGPTGYAGQHQQRPAPAGGSRFKKKYFRYWKPFNDLYQLIHGGGTRIVQKNGCWRFAIMDPAGTEKEQNNKPCYTVVQVWEVTPDSDMLLLDQYREQVETPEAANAAVDLCRRWEVSLLGVEKNGLGLGVVQNIGLKGVAVLPIEARGNKEARSETAEIRMAAGKVYFPHDSPFLSALESELELFPNGEFADQVDAISHAAAIVQDRHGAPKSEQDQEWDRQRDNEIAELVPSGRYGYQF